MLSLVLVCFSLIHVDDGAATPPQDSSERAAYEAARAKAGHDAKAHVRLALWCESHGLGTERMKHLAMAVLYDPSNALARGLMGLVAYQGKWARPDEVSRQAQDDPKRKALLRDYLQRRANTPETADGHWKLALWCEQNGLTQQAHAHFHQVLKRDPSRDAAWKHLGYKKSGGHWIKPELVAAAKARAQEQQRADKHWKPILERYRTALQGKDRARRAKAEQALAQITDRDTVPMIWATFGRGDAASQKVAVQVLGQIDDASASRFLVLLAVFSGSASVRGEAVTTLRHKDAREFAAMLIAMILEPIEYEVKRVGGPGQRGELLIKGQGSAPNLKRLYTPPAAPSVAMQPGDRVYLDQNGLPVIARPEQTWNLPYMPIYGPGSRNWIMFQQPMPTAQQKGQVLGMLAQSGLGGQGQKIGQLMINAFENQVFINNNNPFLSQNSLLPAAIAMMPDNGLPVTGTTFLSLNMASGETIPVGRMAQEAQKTAVYAQKQLDNDVAAIKEYNASLDQINDRVVPILKDISGLAIGPKPAEWQKWYVNLIGYQFNQMQSPDKPMVVEDVPLAYQPQPIPLGQFMGPIATQRVSCFGAGTLVRTLTGLEPIETLKVGDPVLTQNTRTGTLAYKPILAVHHNPPSKTFEVKLGEETVVSSEFHRFWKSGQGWVMARDLKEGDRLRTLDGPVPVTRIERGEVLPVYNLDVAEDADFFVGRGGVLVHDNTLPDLRERPFDAVEALAGPVKNPRPAP
ncbi:MAG: polymorphic toxin-type HINT domain-containing protein [Isosphaeraceae bacterium]